MNNDKFKHNDNIVTSSFRIEGISVLGIKELYFFNEVIIYYISK